MYSTLVLIQGKQWEWKEDLGHRTWCDCSWLQGLVALRSGVTCSGGGSGDVRCSIIYRPGVHVTDPLASFFFFFLWLWSSILELKSEKKKNVLLCYVKICCFATGELSYT